MNLYHIINAIPQGFSKAKYNNKTYGITRTNFNKGKSIKVYAEELGGTNNISFNYYITNTSNNLKPCEMPEYSVIHFLKNYKLINT